MVFFFRLLNEHPKSKRLEKIIVEADSGIFSLINKKNNFVTSEQAAAEIVEGKQSLL